MYLFIIFTIIGLVFLNSFLFGKERFSLSKLLYTLWSFSIGISQLRLSPHENQWNLKFWLVLALFFGLFIIFKQYFDSYWQDKVKTRSKEEYDVNNSLWFWLLLAMSLMTVATNVYIYLRFNTLPLLSSEPEKMRFIINREVFGLWEYLALLPRFIIPLSFVYLLLTKTKRLWPKILAIINITLGFAVLLLYASRVVIIVAILLSYFTYLILQVRDTVNKRIVIASTIAVLFVVFISIAMPVFRHYITFQDYEYEDDVGALSYINELAELNIPNNLAFITPIYIIPSFNTQELMRAINYYDVGEIYFGQYSAGVYNKALKIIHLQFTDVAIPWKQIFLPWWVTGTFLFSYWVDFSYVGIILAALIWSAILSGVYVLAERKPSVFSSLLFAYFGFVTIMTIYTNYFTRAEFYLDFLLIAGVGFILGRRK